MSEYLHIWWAKFIVDCIIGGSILAIMGIVLLIFLAVTRNKK